MIRTNANRCCYCCKKPKPQNFQIVPTFPCLPYRRFGVAADVLSRVHTGASGSRGVFAVSSFTDVYLVWGRGIARVKWPDVSRDIPVNVCGFVRARDLSETRSRTRLFSLSFARNEGDARRASPAIWIARTTTTDVGRRTCDGTRRVLGARAKFKSSSRRVAQPTRMLTHREVRGAIPRRNRA